MECLDHDQLYAHVGTIWSKISWAKAYVSMFVLMESRMLKAAGDSRHNFPSSVCQDVIWWLMIGSHGWNGRC